MEKIPDCAPVIFIIFNRPDVTHRVFEAIAKAQPPILFIISDGARATMPGEREKVEQARAIVEHIDWPCVVHRRYSQHNLGSKANVASGISWAFSIVESAIILEDDCLPSAVFFQYTTEMLARYRIEKRIFSISGSNFSFLPDSPGHYYSNYSLMWGWATWRDRWQLYEIAPKDEYWVLMRTFGLRPLNFAYWLKVFSDLRSGCLVSWDYYWLLTLWRNRAYCCRPTLNLVQNLGFGPSATHTTNSDSKLARLLAVETRESFSKAISTEIAPDTRRDLHDEANWALVHWKTLLLLYFPWISRILNRLR